MAGTASGAGTAIKAGSTRAALVTGLDSELGAAVARRLAASGALTGSFFFAQAAAPHLARGDGGRIVLTASMWHCGGDGLAAVAAAAGGVVALAKTLTRDLGPLGVGVNAVVPGLVEGPWLACDAAGLGVDTDTLRRDPGRFVPTGRLGTADQVAATVAVLADPSLKAAVGQSVNVNGGHVRTRTWEAEP